MLQVKIWLQLLLVFISRFLNGNGQLSKEAKIHISVYAVYFAKSNALISGHQGGGGGLIPGNPRSFAHQCLQIPPTQNQDFLTKSC